MGLAGIVKIMDTPSQVTPLSSRSPRPFKNLHLKAAIDLVLCKSRVDACCGQAKEARKRSKHCFRAW
jgi:hypothetical protein